MPNGLWDSKKHSVSVALNEVVGFGTDNHFKVERMTADLISSQSGVKGEANVSKIYDNRAKITIVLLGDSPSNAKFDLLAKAGIPFPILWKDKSDGGEIGFSEKCYVMTPAVSERGKEYKDKTWVFLALDYNGAYT